MLKLTFGLRGDQLLHISEVERGLGCDCVCPACKHPLVARKGTEKAHHFAHYKADECATAVETALHIAAKNLLEAEGRITIPAVYLEFYSNKEPWLIQPSGEINFDRVSLEQRLGTIVPDVTIVVKNRPLLLEIAVTHKVDEEKLGKIRDFGISAIEIVLAAFSRNPTLDELREAVIFSAANKRWLYNARVQALRQQLLQLATPKKFKGQGLATYVDNCPINASPLHGRSYANVIYDCSACEYDLDSGDAREGFMFCSGDRKIATYEDFVRASSKT
jgi:hypothetical protein